MSTHIEALIRKGGAALDWLMLASSLATIALIAFRTIGGSDDLASNHWLRSCGEAPKGAFPCHSQSDDSLAGFGFDITLAGRLGNGEFASASSDENRRDAAVTATPVSRLDALDEMERLGAGVED